MSFHASSAYYELGEGFLDDWGHWVSEGVGVEVEGEDQEDCFLAEAVRVASVFEEDYCDN